MYIPIRVDANRDKEIKDPCARCTRIIKNFGAPCVYIYFQEAKEPSGGGSGAKGGKEKECAREKERTRKREGFKILYSCRAVCDGSHHLPSQFSRF